MRKSGMMISIPLDKDRPVAYNIPMTKEDLKAWRERNGVSQSQLARALTVDVMTISRWERGVRSIPSFLYLALKYLESEGGEALKGHKRKKKKMRKEGD